MCGLWWWALLLRWNLGIHWCKRSSGDFHRAPKADLLAGFPTCCCRGGCPYPLPPAQLWAVTLFQVKNEPCHPYSGKSVVSTVLTLAEGLRPFSAFHPFRLKEICLSVEPSLLQESTCTAEIWLWTVPYLQLYHQHAKNLLMPRTQISFCS